MLFSPRIKSSKRGPGDALLICGLLLLPFFKIGFGHHFHGAAHLKMPEAAQFRTGDFIRTRRIGLEIKGYLHAGNDILLQAQLADEEVVNHVAGMHDQLDRLAGGHLQGGAHDIILTSRIIIVDTEGIACRVVHQFEIRSAELAVRARIAERKGELLGHELDGDGGRVRLGKVHGGPDARAHEHQAHEKDGCGAGPDGFQPVVAMRIAGAASIVAKTEDHPAQSELRQKKDDAGHHQGPHELGIVGDAVLGDGWRKPPGLSDEEITDDHRQNPNDWSKQHLVWYPRTLGACTPGLDDDITLDLEFASLVRSCVKGGGDLFAWSWPWRVSCAAARETLSQ